MVVILVEKKERAMGGNLNWMQEKKKTWREHIKNIYLLLGKLSKHYTVLQEEKFIWVP